MTRTSKPNTPEPKKSRRIEKLNSKDPRAAKVQDNNKQNLSSASRNRDEIVEHNHTGSYLSYADPKSERAGYGRVGRWDNEKAIYEVVFTFSDGKEPYEHLDLCPLHFVEKHLVAPEVGHAWLEALNRHTETDSPKTKKKQHGLLRKQIIQGSRGVNKNKSDEGSEPQRNHRNTGNSITNIINESQLGDGDKTDDEDEPPLRRRKRKDSTPDGEESDDAELPLRKTKHPKKMDKESSEKDAGTKALLSHAIREGIYAIRPNQDKRIKPFMYWNPNKSTACVKMLLKRNTGLQALADGLRRNEFARLWATEVRTLANNERSSQIRQLKIMYLTNNDFALVSNYHVGTATIVDTNTFENLQLCNSLTSEFQTIQDLRDALVSPKMYTYPKLFDLFCAGLESGRLRGTKPMPISPIESLITVAHEAHFRLELWYAMALTRYRHTISRAYITERFQKHAEVCQMVAQDRRENGTAAFKHRNATVSHIDDDEKESSNDSDDGVSGDYY